MKYRLSLARSVWACGVAAALLSQAPGVWAQSESTNWPDARPVLDGAKLRWSPSLRPELPPSLFKRERGEDKTVRAMPEVRWTLSPATDKTLYHAMRRLTHESGWQLSWETDRDFAIEVQVDLSGPFDEVIRQVMQGVSRTDHPLQASMNHEARLLRIVRYLNPNSN